MTYQTLNVRFEQDLCRLQLHRPEANNTINGQMIDECRQVLNTCHTRANIIVMEGLPEVFCFGADFKGIAAQVAPGTASEPNPEPLYDLWTQLSTGPFVTVAHVRGQANAGGIGFVAACDLVLADRRAQFSLSELLFGLMPACVLPFLIRRMGFQKAHAMTLLTKPVGVEEAHRWGLVDAFAKDSDNLLRQQLLRLRRLNKTAIARYKRYMNDLNEMLIAAKPRALAANRQVFSDPDNLANIARYTQTGRFPWET
jgi:polyketide biosynthesis enoyl-CoA hydratase PksH